MSEITKKLAYRIFAYRGQVTAICFGKEFINANGVEVDGGEVEDIEATLAEKAPMGVGSPWPPVKPAKAPASAPAPKPAKATKAEKVEAPAEPETPAAAPATEPDAPAA